LGNCSKEQILPDTDDGGLSSESSSSEETAKTGNYGEVGYFSHKQLSAAGSRDPISKMERRNGEIPEKGTQRRLKIDSETLAETSR